MSRRRRCATVTSVPFGTVWLAETVSQLGSQVTTVALPLTAVLVLHAAPAEMGLLVAFGSLAFVLVSLPAGLLLDRRDPAAVLVTTNLASAATMLAVPVAYWAGVLSMPLLYGVAAVAGALTVAAGVFDASVGLMVLLIALGAMSIGWMAIVAALVFVQKVVPPRPALDVPLALALVACALI
jgi:predicted metal-binding membrane protein